MDKRQIRIMNGETFHVDPDFVVIFGFRSVMSLIGLTSGLVAHWLSERRWDNDGSSALQTDRNSNENNDESRNGMYIEMNDPNKVVGQRFHNNGARELVRVNTDDSDDKRYHPGECATKQTEPIQSVVAAQFYGTPEVVQARLLTAYPLSRMYGGLFLWSISFLLDPSIGGIRFYVNFYNVSSFLLSATLGPILAFPMRNATIKRNAGKKKRITLAFATLSLSLCFVAIADPMVNAPWYFNVFGALFVLASSVVFSTSRKMGFKSWLLEGKPKTSAKVYVQNLGPLLLIFGIFLFWVGTNAVLMADLNQSYLPFWATNTRGWFVFSAGFVLIIPGHLAMDFAFDEGSLPIVHKLDDVDDGSLSAVYRLDGNTFTELTQNFSTQFDIGWIARLLETPLLGSIGWFLMGFCSFLPFGVTELTVQKFFTLTVCFTIAPVQFLLVTPALWRSDAEAYIKWSYIYYGLMVSLAISTGISHGIALLLSIFAIGLILAGERKYMYDERKRGHMWLTGNPPAINPNPQVYGLGQPLFLLGWILLCTAMSIPM